MNITTEDLTGYFRNQEERKKMILEVMKRSGEPMMLYQFKDEPVVYNRLSIDLNQLHDEGLVSRHINGGKLEFRVNK